MNNRSIVFAIFVGALLLEGFLLIRSGLLAWLVSGPHTPEELRVLMFDWRTLMSVGLVTIILWLAVRWFRLGAVERNCPPDHLNGPGT
jgi:hypothetical protein